MNLTIERKNLIDLLTTVARVIHPRSPKLALTCVLIQATSDEVTLTGTNLEQTVRASTAACDVPEPGEVLVPAHTLMDVLKRATSETVTLGAQDSTLGINAGGFKARVHTMPAADYPTVTDAVDGQPLTVPADALRAMLASTIPAATTNENSRYAINGVLLVSERGKLTAVATDGHRLHLRTAGVKCDTLKAIVPAGACRLLLSVLGESDVTLTVADNRLHAKGTRRELWTSLIEGAFPPYNDVIPKDNGTTFNVDSGEFLVALEQAATLTSEESKGVRLACSAEGVTLTSRAPERGDAEAHAGVTGYTGEPIEIGFNPGYLADAVKACGDDAVRIELKRANAPGIVRGDGYVAVVMPINLQ